MLDQLTELDPGTVRNRATGTDVRIVFEAAVLRGVVPPADPRVAEVLSGYAESDLHAAHSELVAAVRALARRTDPRRPPWPRRPAR